MRENILERKKVLRTKRKLRTRGKVFGVADMPRVTIFRSNKYFYAQAINDTESRTLVAVDGKKMGLGNNKENVAMKPCLFATTPCFEFDDLVIPYYTLDFEGIIGYNSA